MNNNDDNLPSLGAILLLGISAIIYHKWAKITATLKKLALLTIELLVAAAIVTLACAILYFIGKAIHKYCSERQIIRKDALERFLKEFEEFKDSAQYWKDQSNHYSAEAHSLRTRKEALEIQIKILTTKPESVVQGIVAEVVRNG